MTATMSIPPAQGARRSLAILGATGSVGRSAIALIQERPELFDVRVVTANANAERLAAQARAVGARRAVVADPRAYGALKQALAGSAIEAQAGEAAVIEAAAAEDAQMVIAAIVGSAGMAPVFAAAARGAVIALANKEALVCGGALLLETARRGGAVLLPLDSEHSAIFQALRSGGAREVARLILTASGGPFRESSRADMAAATPAMALAHPNWSMGPKISIDSATMMNKALELIEAALMFDTPEDRIEVVVHAQSIIHSAVTFCDGSTIAQMGPPDMRTPISCALAWPARLDWKAPILDLAALGRLDFEAPDLARFPALGLARRALRRGGTAPMLLNAANEMAVDAFLQGRIGFLDIAAIVEEQVDVAAPICADLGSLLAEDEAARRRAAGAIDRFAAKRAS